MTCGFLKTAKVHLMACKQVERLQCFCYLVVFSTSSPGCVMLLLGVSWAIDFPIFLIL